jgi:response regulator NasT
MSLRVLIADDEPLIRVDLRELLEAIGYEVVAEARDGTEALNLIREKKPDVAILDVKMPGIDGIDLAKKISHRYPVIILTAYSDRRLIDRARHASVMAYLTKPFREADLSPVIEFAVSHFIEKSALSNQVSRLSEELETRKLVDKAKGLLMKSENLSEAEAYRRIQRTSMDKSRPMKEVAEAIILTHS